MAKRTKPFITRIQAEGTSSEKSLETQETLAEAMKLSNAMPGDIPNQTVYMRNLVTKVFMGKVDYPVFYQFLKLTNAWDLFYSVEARARLIAEGQIRRQKSG
jgi:hypothetical protein